MTPYGDAAWHRYDITNDPGEANDVAADRGEVCEAMKAEHERSADEVVVFELDPDDNAKHPVAINASEKLSIEDVIGIGVVRATTFAVFPFVLRPRTSLAPTAPTAA